MDFRKYTLKELQSSGQLVTIIPGVLYFTSLQERPSSAQSIIEAEACRVRKAKEDAAIAAAIEATNTSILTAMKHEDETSSARARSCVVGRMPPQVPLPQERTAALNHSLISATTAGPTGPPSLKASVTSRPKPDMCCTSLHPADAFAMMDTTRQPQKQNPLGQSSATMPDTASCTSPTDPLFSLGTLELELARLLSQDDGNGGSCAMTEEAFFFSISNDPTFFYSYFFEDFGPLDLGCVVRFSRRLARLLHYTNGWEWAAQMYQSFNDNHFQFEQLTVEDCRAVISMPHYKPPYLRPSVSVRSEGYLFTKLFQTVAEAHGNTTTSDAEGGVERPLQGTQLPEAPEREARGETTEPSASVGKPRSQYTATASSEAGQQKVTVPVVFCCGLEGKERTNAICLLGCFCVAVLGWRPGDFEKLLTSTQGDHHFYPPVLAFRDASAGAASYPLHIQDVLAAVEKAVALRWLNVVYFDLEGFQEGKRLDYSWLVPYKLLAFSSPDDSSRSRSGTVCAEALHHLGITMVIRLNDGLYSTTPFLRKGIQMRAMEYPDGTAPRDAIVSEFLRVTEAEFGEQIVTSVAAAVAASSSGNNVSEDPRLLVGGAFKGLPPALTREPSRRLQLAAPKDTSATATKKRKAMKACGAVAVHCRAGLGRTGTLIGIYVMRHYFLTAREVIAWLRLCRPGSVSGVQQQFLEVIERRLAVPSRVLERQEGMNPRSIAVALSGESHPPTATPPIPGEDDNHNSNTDPGGKSSVQTLREGPHAEQLNPPPSLSTGQGVAATGPPKPRPAPDVHTTFAYQPHGEIPLDAARAGNSLLHLVASNLGPEEKKTQQRQQQQLQRQVVPRGDVRATAAPTPPGMEGDSASLPNKGSRRRGHSNDSVSSSTSSSQLVLAPPQAGRSNGRVASAGSHRCTPNLENMMMGHAGTPGMEGSSTSLGGSTSNAAHNTTNGTERRFSARREGSNRLSERRRDVLEAQGRVFDGAANIFLPPKDMLEGLRYPSSYLLALEISKPYHTANQLRQQFVQRLAVPGPQTTQEAAPCPSSHSRPQQRPAGMAALSSQNSGSQISLNGVSEPREEPQGRSAAPRRVGSAPIAPKSAHSTHHAAGGLGNSSSNPDVTSHTPNSSTSVRPGGSHTKRPTGSGTRPPLAARTAATGGSSCLAPTSRSGISPEAAAQAIAAAGIHVPTQHTRNAALTRRRAVAQRYQALRQEDIHLRAADRNLEEERAQVQRLVFSPGVGEAAAPKLQREYETAHAPVAVPPAVRAAQQKMDRGAKPISLQMSSPNPNLYPRHASPEKRPFSYHSSTGGSDRGVSPQSSSIRGIDVPCVTDRLVPLNDCALQLHLPQNSNFLASISSGTHGTAAVRAPPAQSVPTPRGVTPSPSPQVTAQRLNILNDGDTALTYSKKKNSTAAVHPRSRVQARLTEMMAKDHPSPPSSTANHRASEMPVVAALMSPVVSTTPIFSAMMGGGDFPLSRDFSRFAAGVVSAGRGNTTVTMVAGTPNASHVPSNPNTPVREALNTGSSLREEGTGTARPNPLNAPQQREFLNAAKTEWCSSPGWVSPLLKLGRA